MASTKVNGGWHMVKHAFLAGMDTVSLLASIWDSCFISERH